MARLRKDHLMVVRAMVARDVPVRQVARDLGVDESTLRYHLARGESAPDGRRDRKSILDGWQERIAAVLDRFADPRVGGDAVDRVEVSVVHGVLRREFGFTGSYQSVRRHLERHYPASAVRAMRRVETPPGVQAQHDWFDVAVRIAGTVRPLHGLIGTLSHSRARFVWMSPVMHQLAWQSGHVAIFTRYGGVPLWVRIDNLKTAVASGAGPTAVLTPAFATFARTCGFAVDPCRAATGSDKGKTERSVRTARTDFADLFVHAWPDLPHLQAALDERSAECHATRRCPITGTLIADAHAAEQRLLQTLPTFDELFDCVVARRVSRDCLVSFEGRRYSVPFAWVGRTVEVRGTTQHVVVWGEGRELARHPRGTTRGLVLEEAHFNGASTTSVLAPTPLGRRAQQQLTAIAQAALLPPPAQLERPVAQYAQLIDRLVGEVA
ncbi:IS21 family transposase [Gemmatimonas sp.]|uniref:IS21 family transposase n=1 Tax=Gemmatimonas sp. TaxID=1962908 RepID=UPI00286E6A6C|nr:IS21 family transposase [Gemmatimonas sp.]